VEEFLDEDKVTSSLASASVRELPPASLVLLTLQALLCTLDPECGNDLLPVGLLDGDWLLTGAGVLITKSSMAVFMAD
jgi:hypothetical protein